MRVLMSCPWTHGIRTYIRIQGFPGDAGMTGGWPRRRPPAAPDMRASDDDPARNGYCFPDRQRPNGQRAAGRNRRRPRTGTAGHDGNPRPAHLRVGCTTHPHVGGAHVLRPRLGPVRRVGRRRFGVVDREAAALGRPGPPGSPPRRRMPRPGGGRRRTLPGRAGSKHRHHPGPLRSAVPLHPAVPRPRREAAPRTRGRLGPSHPRPGLPAAALVPVPRRLPCSSDTIPAGRICLLPGASSATSS